MTTAKKTLLVVCPNVWDEEALARPQLRDRYRIVRTGSELICDVNPWRAITFDAIAWLKKTAHRHRGVDGVVGTGDYPGSMFAAMIAEHLSLPSAGARAVVMQSHKYYARETQRSLVADATPDFEAIDPLSDREPTRLRYPYFMKPVKGTMSIRAQLVRSRKERRALTHFSLRERIEKRLLLKPFQQLLQHHGDGRVPAHWFIAESPLAGEQVTVDGFVENGKVTIQGIVDSIFYPGTRSFARFQLPSRLPAHVQTMMREVTTKLVEGCGLDRTCFNVELFWDAHGEDRDAVTLIELNPRMSYQFGDLYERVDGTSTYDLQVRLALGEPTNWKKGAGADRMAASFVMRRFEDARVTSVPSDDDVAKVRAKFPGAVVKVLVAKGDRLSKHDQDVGSFRYCIVNLGAGSVEELEGKYREVEGMLRFGFG